MIISLLQISPYAGDGKWWWSRNAAPWTNHFCNGPGNACRKSLAEITALFPNARIIDKMMLKAGSGWTDFDGTAGALIEVNPDHLNQIKRIARRCDTRPQRIVETDLLALVILAEMSVLDPAIALCL